jgi:acyl-CoA thioester hydrolase
MVFKHSLRVHWVDTDTAGVMHFSNYFRYAETCEEEFYRSLSLPLTEIHQKFGILLPRIEAHCQYKTACKFDDLIEVTLKIREVQEKTITYDFQLIRESDRKVAAEGFIKCIAVNSEWKAVPLPPAVATALRSTML